MKATTMVEYNDTKHNETEFPYFFIQCDGKGKLVRISKEDITYVESALNYLVIHLQSSSYTTYLTITEMERVLPVETFIRVHKSFLINLEKIIGVEGNMLQLSNNTRVALGPSYRKSFFDRLEPMLVRSKRKG